MRRRTRPEVAGRRLDLNATQAAIRAGYSAKSARTDGPRMLSNAVVGSRRRDHPEAHHQAKVSGNYVIEEIAKLAFVNMDDNMRVVRTATKKIRLRCHAI